MGFLPRMKEILDPKHPRGDGLERYYPVFWQGQHATNSDMYGLLAMLNWYRIKREMDAIVAAIEEDQLALRLVETVHSHNGQRGKRLKDTLAWLAVQSNDERLKTAIRKVYHKDLQPPQPRGEKPIHLRTHRRPEHFKLPEGYRPPEGKKVLLMMACSKGKPYRTSNHQKQVLADLAEAYPEKDLWDRLHKVTLSGLYGPVPREREDEEPVTDYDFMLEVGDETQAMEVEARLRRFLTSAGKDYEQVFAYIYFPAYRAVVQKVFAEFNLADRVFPRQLERGLTPIDYRAELIKAFGADLNLHKATPSAEEFLVKPEYTPPDGKDVLLLLPSQGRTPYAGSGDQKAIMALLKKTFPEEYPRVHRVTLSALFGPVPEEREDQAPADSLRLESVSREQTNIVEERLRAFLATAGRHYPGGVIAYMRGAKYRELVTRVFHETNAGAMVPSVVNRELRPAQYQDELVRLLADRLHRRPITQLQFPFE
jgi:hypothetical protein